MSPAPKALAHGMLIFLEITVVVLFVMSLAAIAVISSLGAANGTDRSKMLTRSS